MQPSTMFSQTSYPTFIVRHLIKTAASALLVLPGAGIVIIVTRYRIVFIVAHTFLFIELSNARHPYSSCSSNSQTPATHKRLAHYLRTLNHDNNNHHEVSIGRAKHQHQPYSLEYE
jgi:hypothetical protein